MRLVEQWLEIERDLPEGWRQARLELTLPDEQTALRGAAVLAPAAAGRSGQVVRFTAGRALGVSSERIKRLLWRLDSEWITGELKVATVEERAPAREIEWERLAPAWDAETALLPEDWSDALVQVDFNTSDLERAALLMSPVNPARHDTSPSFRFRAARRFGYGAAPAMTRRCFERLDGEGIRGTVRLLHVLSDTDPVDTQGPVWYVGGRPV